MSSGKMEAGASKSKRSKRVNIYQNLWNDIIGIENRNCIPANKLPTNRIIMQRYHTMRNGTWTPKNAPVRPFAVTIFEEVKNIWDKANVPMKAKKACVEHLVRLLTSWSKFLAGTQKLDPSSEKVQSYRSMMDQLCDLAIGDDKAVYEAMRTTRFPTWERDYKFYVNNKSGVNDQMEGLDKIIVSR